jgi:hypothetical protein
MRPVSGFSPLAVKETVHHMMLVGCSAPVSLPPARDNLWNCGGSLGKHTLSAFCAKSYNLPSQIHDLFSIESSFKFFTGLWLTLILATRAGKNFQTCKDS